MANLYDTDYFRNWKNQNINNQNINNTGSFDYRNALGDNWALPYVSQDINTPLPSPYQDRIMNEDLMRIQQNRGNIDNKGFNFPSIFGTVKGGLEWLGDKFKRPEAKQRAYEEIMKGGTYKGKPGYELYETPSGLKVGSDILGTGQGYAKNFDSMFGSQSLEEMEQKKLDWAAERLRTGKGLSQRLRNILKQRGITQDDSKTTDIAPVTTTSGGTGGPNVHGGGSEASFTRTSPGGISQATSRAARTDQGGNVMSGWRLAEGGRIGYRERGFVDPEEVDELSIFDFMKDQGIDYDQMAEAVPQEFPSDALGAINVNEEQMAMISDLNDKGMDISLISTISGADEDTVTRIIRLLNAKAQGGSVGYFDGGIASLV